MNPSQAGDPVPDAAADGEDPSRAGEPVLDGSVGGEDLLGLRIGAAMIDLALLLVLFVVLAVVVGEAIVNRVGVAFSFSLDGAGFAVYVALALLYYLVLEAAIGQTVGKLLVGLRVVRAGGGRP
ncbi:MAG: RDD family protein, partial [Micromonosporaceae bacterium]